MALLPKKGRRKTRLFAPSQPNYSDFSGPPDGNYVRYVEELMAWAEHAQEHQRLPVQDSQSPLKSSEQEWGRTTAKRAASTSSMASVSSTAPGSVEGALARIQRKAKQPQPPVQAQAPQPTANHKPTSSKQVGVVFVMMVMVALVFFKPQLIPVAIFAWVFFNIVKTFRKASQSTKR